ncbi:MAG: Na+/H+ antiporter NhaA [Dermatophilaceae bacterium]
MGRRRATGDLLLLAGLELKREFVARDLRNPRRAALPVAAAVGGMVVPGGLFLAINANTGGDALRGWAAPVATDIAFALAVLAVIGPTLPFGPADLSAHLAGAEPSARYRGHPRRRLQPHRGAAPTGRRSAGAVWTTTRTTCSRARTAPGTRTSPAAATPSTPTTRSCGG